MSSDESMESEIDDEKIKNDDVVGSESDDSDKEVNLFNYLTIFKNKEYYKFTFIIFYF